MHMNINLQFSNHYNRTIEQSSTATDDIIQTAKGLFNIDSDRKSYHASFFTRLLSTCLLASLFLLTLSSKAQCGDGSTGNGDCGSFGGVSYIADVTTVPSVGLNTWNTLSTANLSKPYWVFKNVQRGTIIRLANCTGEDSEFSISGPSGFTYIKRDGDNEFNVGLGCSPNGNDESMYLYCTQTGDYNISIIRNGCNNFSNAGTKYLYWNVTNRPCSGGTSYGSGVWNGYVYDGTGPDYFYGSIGLWFYRHPTC